MEEEGRQGGCVERNLHIEGSDEGKGGRKEDNEERKNKEKEMKRDASNGRNGEMVKT